MGGMMLIGKGDDGLKWIFCEDHFGDKPAPNEVVEAINGLVPMEPKALPPRSEGQSSTSAPVQQPAAQAPSSNQPSSSGAVIEKPSEKVAQAPPVQQMPQ